MMEKCKIGGVEMGGKCVLSADNIAFPSLIKYNAVMDIDEAGDAGFMLHGECAQQ